MIHRLRRIDAGQRTGKGRDQTEQFGRLLNVARFRISGGSIDLQAVVVAGEPRIAYAGIRAAIQFLLGDFANLVARYVPGSSSIVLVPTVIYGPGSETARSVSGSEIGERVVLITHLMR